MAKQPLPAGERRQYLVTGVTGQVGHELFRRLGEDHCLARTRDSLDLTNASEVQRQIELLQPTAVINAAAYTHVQQAETAGREKCWAVNVAATANLAKICALNSVPFVHISDGDVFGGRGHCETGYRETDAVFPLGWYASTKAQAEQAIFSLRHSMSPRYWNMGFKYWVLRTSELFERPWRSSNNMFYSIARWGTVRKSKHGDFPASAGVYRSFTYVPHLVDAILWLLDNMRDVPSGLYHVANQGRASVFQAANALAISQDFSFGIRPGSLQEMAAAMDRDTDLLAEDTSLNCGRWAEVCPVPMPSIKQALLEYGRELSSK